MLVAGRRGLRRRPPGRRDPRRGEGARDHRPAGDPGLAARAARARATRSGSRSASSSSPAAAGSTLLALRDAPVGFDERQLGLEQLGRGGRGRAGRLPRRRPLRRLLPARHARPRARPATCPRRSPPARTRPGPRAWRPTSTRSTPASSTGSATRSPPPPPTGRRRRPNFEPVLERRRLRALAPPGRDPAGEGAARARAASARRRGLQPRRRLRLRRAAPPKRDGEAGAARRAGPSPTTPSGATPAPPEARVAGQERGWQAPGDGDDRARAARRPRRATRLSLQYHSQVPLDGDRRRREDRRRCRPRSTACT